MKRARIAVGLLSSAFALAGCPENLEKRCPSASAPVGSFQLSLAPQTTAGQCQTVVTDGGTPDASTPTLATLCVSIAADGVATVYLATTGTTTRKSLLRDDAGFSFDGGSRNVGPSNPCGCIVDIDETITGNLLGPDGGPATRDADGGLTPVTTISGTVVDRFSGDAGGCVCTLPCSLTFSLSGVRN